MIDNTLNSETSFLKSLLRFFLAYILSIVLFVVTYSFFANAYIALIISVIVGLGTINWFHLSQSWQLAIVLSLGYSAFRATAAYSADGLQSTALAIATIYLLIQLPTLFTRIPFYPTKGEMLVCLEQILATGPKGFSFADLGSGFGGVLFPLAQRFPESKFVGYELAPIPYLNSKIRSLFYKNVTIKYQSFWNANLESYNVIYAFLSPEAAPKLEAMYNKILNPACTLFVHSFKLDRLEYASFQTKEGILYTYTPLAKRPSK